MTLSTIDSPAQSAGAIASSRPPLGGADPRAWQREMERAQLSGWFKGFSPSRDQRSASRESLGEPAGASKQPAAAARHDALPSTPSRTASPGHPSPVAACARHALAPGLSHPRAFATQPGLGEVASGSPANPLNMPSRIASAPGIAAMPLGPTHAQTVPSPGLPESAADEAAPATNDEALSRAARARQGDEAGLVRLHIERAADGLALWLGVDGEAAQAQQRAQAIVQALRRHALASGVRLASAVCNGQPIDLHAHAGALHLPPYPQDI